MQDFDLSNSSISRSLEHFMILICRNEWYQVAWTGSTGLTAKCLIVTESSWTSTVLYGMYYYVYVGCICLSVIKLRMSTQ